MAHLEYLRSIYELAGKDVADIGAGDGVFSAQLDASGAAVTGIEIDSGKVEIAKMNLSDTISMRVGRAEKLPLGDGSMDLACFFFSFHHVPMDKQDEALAEAMRILKITGRLHIVEPYPYGSMFDVVRIVEDETEVRTHSHHRMNSLGDGGAFNLIARKDYTLTREYSDFATFTDRIVNADPNRSAVFPSVMEEMEKTYRQAVSDQDGKQVLHQPCAAYHFAIKP